jgi:hypothetical protein
MILSDLEIAEKLEEYGVPNNVLDAAVVGIQNFRIQQSNRGRDAAVVLARNLFVKTGVERNISKAVELLFSVIDTDFPVMLTKENKYSSVKKIPYSIRPKCPDCGNRMMLWEVNNDPKKMVGGDYKTQWICPDEADCGYQGEYSTMTVEEQIIKYG